MDPRRLPWRGRVAYMSDRILQAPSGYFIVAAVQIAALAPRRAEVCECSYRNGKVGDLCGRHD